MPRDFHVKKAKQFRNNSKRIGKINSTSVSEEVESDRDTPSGLSVILHIDEVPTSPLPVVDIDQVPTEVRLSVIFNSSSSFPAIDSNQTTWRLPAVPKSEINSSLISPSGTQTSGGESYQGLIRNLIKSSGIYAISALASPLVSLVLAPYLTHSLSKTDYGALTVLNTVITLATSITQLGLSSSIPRAYNYDYENEQDQLGVLSTAIILISLVSIAVAITAVFTSPWIARFLFGDSTFSTPVQITALAILAQNLSVPGLAWLRAENRAKIFSVLAIINLSITLIANIVLVGPAHMGITGSLLATGAGYALIVVSMFPLLLLRTGLTLRLDIFKNLLSFGIPLVFNYVSFWVLQLSDRYLLSRLGSLAQTASYSVAYTLGGALNAVVLAPFILAWPTVMYAIAKRKDAPTVFQIVFRWFSLILLLAAFVLALIAVTALNMFFPASYHSATSIIPVIAVSAAFFGIYNIFSVGLGVKRKTWITALIMTFSSLVNVGSNFVLIPLYGSMGAAISTLIAFILLAIITYVVNQRIYHIPFEVGKFLIALLVGIVIYVQCVLLSQQQKILFVLVIYMISTILYSGCLVLLAIFPRRKNRA